MCEGVQTEAIREAFWGVVSTPFGDAVITLCDCGVMSLEFLEAGDLLEVPERVRITWRDYQFIEDRKRAVAVAQSLFVDDPTRQPLRCFLRGSTFQHSVWNELRKIPFGETRTYGAVAAAIGMPEGARAVGAAVGQNPIGFVIPCHRVVPASGGPGGFRWGQERKSRMLAFEAKVTRRNS